MKLKKSRKKNEKVNLKTAIALQMNFVLNTHLYTSLYLRQTLIANNQLVGRMERVLCVMTLANAIALQLQNPATAQQNELISL